MAVGSIQPFAASGPANTVTVAASTTPTTATLPGTMPASSAGAMPSGDESLLVFNSTTNIAFVRLGGAATVADLPVPPGGSRLLHAGPYVTTVGVVLAAGSGAVYFTRGSGSAY